MRLLAIIWLSVFLADVCRAGVTWIQDVEPDNPDSELSTSSQTSKPENTVFVSKNVDTDVAAMTPSSPTCTECDAGDEKKKRLEYIKDLIIKKLGMKQAPVLNVPMAIPSNLNDLLRSDMQSDHPADEPDVPEEFFAETKKVISFARTRPHTTECCFFKFTPDVRQNKIWSAYLWVYVQPSQTIHDSIPLLKIYGLMQQIENAERPKYLLNETKIDTRHRSGWMYFNVKRTVQHWLGEPSTNWGIEIVSPNAMDLVVTGPIETGNNQLPYLEIQTSHRGHTRSERSAAPDCPTNGEVNYCCRHPLVVNFKELGMDWIVEPKSYEAYYCSGECDRMNPFNPYPYYSLLVSRHGIEQCCNPSKMRGIQIIYYTDSYTARVDVLLDMVVKKCVCS